MKFIQIGELGKAIAVSTYSDLPTAGIAYLDHYFVAQDTKTIYTCMTEGSGYAWKVVKVLPTLSNGIAAGSQLLKDVEAIDASGNKVTGTFVTGEKVIEANGTYYPNDDNVGAYSQVTVNVAGETAENPYIATTESELLAYLAEEYKDSYVRYDNSSYRPNLPLVLKPRYADDTFDTNLGQNSINALIDKWLGTDTSKKILGYENQGYYLLSEGGYNLYIYRHYIVEIHAYKLLKSDGTYCRAIAGVDAFGQNVATSATGYDASTASFDKDGMILYIDNCTESEFNSLFSSYSYELTVDDHTETIASLNLNLDAQLSTGWIYEYVAAIDTSNRGAAYFSDSIYRFDNDVCKLTFAYSNASVLIAQALYINNKYIGQESTQTYRDGYTYKVNRTDKKLSSYQAESPLAVGDQAAGATWYLNPNFTLENLEDVINEISPTEYAGSNVGFVFLDVDNPFTLDSDSDESFNNLWGFVLMRINGQLGADIIMYSLAGDGSDITPAFLMGSALGTPINNFQQASITVPTTWGENLIAACTTPATISKINHPEILNQFVGKTANFTMQDTIVTSYNFIVADALGNMTEIGNSNNMKSIVNNGKAPWIIPNTVVRYTGKDDEGYKQGALYIITEGE